MKVQTGETYAAADYAKSLLVSDAKAGKTAFIVGSALGVLPWQTEGGIVSNPSDLHVVTFDASALGGIQKFLTQSCGAPADALKFNVWNFQDDARRVAESGSGGLDNDLFTKLVDTRDRIGQKAKGRGTPMVVISSLTGMALAIERSLMGRPDKRGYGDQNKWTMLTAQLFELQSLFQTDDWHLIWEGHIYKPPATGQQGPENPAPKETLQVRGKAGHNWAYNVEQVFRLRREFGRRHGDSPVEMAYLDTKPSLDFIQSGRGFTESLKAKEYDMTSAFRKLGLKVGHWGGAAPAKKKKAEK